MKRLFEAIFDIDDDIFSVKSENDIVGEYDRLDFIAKKYSNFLELFIDSSYLKNDSNIINALDIFFSKYDTNKGILKCNSNYYDDKNGIINIPLDILKPEIRNIVKNEIDSEIEFIGGKPFINIRSIFIAFLSALQVEDFNFKKYSFIKEILIKLKNFKKEFQDVEIPSNYDALSEEADLYITTVNYEAFIDNIDFALTAFFNEFFIYDKDISIRLYNTTDKNFWNRFKKFFTGLAKFKHEYVSAFAFKFYSYNKDNDLYSTNISLIPFNIDNLLFCVNRYDFQKRVVYFEFLLNHVPVRKYNESIIELIENYLVDRKRLQDKEKFTEWINTYDIIKRQYDDFIKFKNAIDNVFEMGGKVTIDKNTIEFILNSNENDRKIITFKFNN